VNTDDHPPLDPLTRGTLLRRAGTGALGLSAASLLAACGSSGSSGSSAAGGGSSSGAIPGPWSLTDTSTVLGVTRPSTVMRPPSGEYLTALPTRFEKT